MARQANTAPQVDAPTWPADRVERWSIDKLIPSARNARVHSDAQVAQIAASLKEWGWTIPVLVDENGVLIAGHGRVLAARQLGLDSVPTMVAAGWSEGQKRAYMLADNKLTLNGTWDNAMLTVEMGDLKDMGFDMNLIGFSPAEMGVILEGWNSNLTFDEHGDVEPPGFTIKISGVDVTRKAELIEVLTEALADFDGIAIE